MIWKTNFIDREKKKKNLNIVVINARKCMSKKKKTLSQGWLMHI